MKLREQFYRRERTGSMKATLAVGLISTLLMAQVVVQVGCSEPQRQRLYHCLQSESKRRKTSPEVGASRTAATVDRRHRGTTPEIGLTAGFAAGRDQRECQHRRLCRDSRRSACSEASSFRRTRPRRSSSRACWRATHAIPAWLELPSSGRKSIGILIRFRRCAMGQASWIRQCSDVMVNASAVATARPPSSSTPADLQAPPTESDRVRLPEASLRRNERRTDGAKSFRWQGRARRGVSGMAPRRLPGR